MTCAEMITSEDYSDWIVNEDNVNLNEQDEGCRIAITRRINSVYYPIENVPDLSLTAASYESIPKCYTILEEPENVETAVTAAVSHKQQLTGNGVIIGLIDTGIRYESALFRNADGSTRILSVWDQTGTQNPPAGFVYGSEYTKENIDEALRSENPQQLVPVTDENGHGTFLASVTAGAGVG